MNKPLVFRTCVSIIGATALAAMAAPSQAAPTPEEIALVNRVAWGADRQSLDDIDRLGADRWLQGQLHPGPAGALPDAVAQRIAALPVNQMSMSQMVLDARQRNADLAKLPTPEARRDARHAAQKQKAELISQAQEQSVLHSLNDANQLQERMTWFWGNYFSVYAKKGDVAFMVGDYEDHALRPNALGRFRDLLEATLRHPAMQTYLDNAKNTKGHINENYAREIMELHTMGVGSGYTQKDVEELARILTGVGVNVTAGPVQVRSAHAGDLVLDGMFIFNPDRHDYGDKVLLGHKITGGGYREVEQVLDILSREPATARHVTKAMATYFLGEPPPPELQDAMSAAFLKSDGDIPTVLQVLFASKAFQDSLGHQFKPPVAYVYSAARTASPNAAQVNPAVVRQALTTLGEGLFERLTPDGFPMDSAAWSGPGQMITRFDVARRLGRQVALAQGGGDAQVIRTSGAGLSNATQSAISTAQSPAERNALYFSSPEFMRF